MDMLTFLQALMATDSPLLPTPWLARAVMPWAWGLVLAALWSVLSMRFLNTKWVWIVAALIVLMCLIPAPWSPAYWLALAFQMPSLTLVFVSTSVIIAPQRVINSALERHWFSLGPGIALGWILLLDTLALWPVSIYSFGFSTLAICVVALVVGLPIVISGNSDRPTAGVGLMAIFLFASQRLPTGNVWDAVLDPWLWAALHVLFVMAWLRRRATKQ